MALNRNKSIKFPTIGPIVMAGIPSMQLRTRALQLKFVTRFQSLPVPTMVRAIEPSHLWKGLTPQDKQWRRLTSINPFHQQYKKLLTGPTPPKSPVAEAIDKKLDDEFTSRRTKYNSIRCLRPQRLVDPILYLAASSKDRHRLVKWQANRDHYTNCPLLRPLYQELLEVFGPISDQRNETQALDHIMNSLPRPDTGLTRGNKPPYFSQDKKPVLYGYFRSSATWRLRAILEWKKIKYDYVPVNLLKQEQRKEEFAKVNPSMKLPAFVTKDGRTLTQSVAVMEYIEEAYPERPCMPKDLMQRALVREICNEIACDIHPIQNPMLVAEIAGQDMEKRNAWSREHISRGFKALEAKLNETKKTDTPGKYCVGDNVTMADFLLVPQVYNAKRFAVDMSAYPTLQSIHSLLMTLPEFIDSSPEKQSDCPPEIKN
ncbi:glutathione S-transferase [Fennellomyces sp. T-0311]|nr:glutathione S-transferase [Fennellomyces sp. T-0311]